MAMTSIVPAFFLFGEPVRTVEGKFLHLESLDDRTRPNDWNIRAHAHADLNHIFHITAGAGVMRAEDRAVTFAAPCLLLVPSGVVHGFDYEVDSAGSVLTIADSYLRELCAREPDFGLLFRAPTQVGLGAASPIGAALGEIARELNWTAPGRSAAIDAHLSVVMVEALRRLAHTKAADPAIIGPQAALVARLRALIDAHFKRKLSVSDYAQRLGVSVVSLRRACATVAGVPVTTLIQDRLILEAKRALLYSNMSVAEVAFHLGFEDPAYFTRLFTKICGRSPRVFRHEEGRGAHGPAPGSSRPAEENVLGV